MKTYSSRHYEIPDHSPTLILPCSGPSPWTNMASFMTALASLPDPFPLALYPFHLPSSFSPAPSAPQPHPSCLPPFFTFYLSGSGPPLFPLQSSFMASKPFLPLPCRALPGLCFILPLVYQHQHLRLTSLPALSSAHSFFWCHWTPLYRLISATLSPHCSDKHFLLNFTEDQRTSC